MYIQCIYNVYAGGRAEQRLQRSLRRRGARIRIRVSAGYAYRTYEYVYEKEWIMYGDVYVKE
jgi:hypothetical protein